MKITILSPGPGEEDEIIVKVKELSPEMLSLIGRFKEGGSRDNIAGYFGESIVMIPISEIYYFDSVDNRVYLYTRDKCFEVKKKLFEIEEEY
ncbi:MAG: LytTR family transcriptional regulator DNA-binding domain-containing protein, partial [Lachnospiraceae bacterium]|nr:LytTR family transcriptional regulator DNA-binding domain-containing protein [Lachnospiraceae bacterium]